MVALKGTTITSIPLDEVGEGPRLVDPEGELVAAARAVGIELGA